MCAAWVKGLLSPVMSAVGTFQKHILLGWVATVDVISGSYLVFKCLLVSIKKNQDS